MFLDRRMIERRDRHCDGHTPMLKNGLIRARKRVEIPESFVVAEMFDKHQKSKAALTIKLLERT